MIKAVEMVAIFTQMRTDRWGYIPETSGEMWTQAKQDAATGENVRKYGQQWVGHRVADCSGAFVYAYRQRGLSIYHGSNRIAREYVVELLPISQARPGMAAFKARDSTQKLPKEYLPGGSHYNGDTKDYYHIGLVDADGQHVINAQSTQTGVVKSDLNGWDCVARLKAVEYPDTEEDMSDIKYVWAPTGDSVFLRPRASTNANYICKVPIGSQVEVLGTTSTGWSGVRYGEKTGYMMNQFLVDALPGEDAGQQTAQESTVDQTRAALYAAREAIDKALLLLSPAG